jgi:hypothetical protein
MIHSFACAETEKLFHGEVARRFPPSIQRVARRKLLQLHAAVAIRDMAVPLGEIGSSNTKVNGLENTVSGLMISGGFASGGRGRMRGTLKWSIIIERQ